MNLFVREKDDYMFLYESFYLFSYIIDISVELNHIFTNNHVKILRYELSSFILQNT